MCLQYQLSKLQEEENGRDEVDDIEGGSPVVDKDANTAPDASCQCKAPGPAPQADPLTVHMAPRCSTLAMMWRGQSSCAKLTLEEWFSKYMMY